MGDVPDGVMALVRAVPEWSGAALVVSELQGGITNRNYRIDVGDRAYVVRLPGERTELLGIDRAGEVEAARRAASLGIGPAVFGTLPGTGTVITEFVPGVATADPGELLEVFGREVGATVTEQPLYDPEGARVRG